jgi:hypothetical protein
MAPVPPERDLILAGRHAGRSDDLGRRRDTRSYLDATDHRTSGDSLGGLSSSSCVEGARGARH